MFKSWTTQKIQEYVEKLEEMYAQGVRQSTFKDQTLIFGSTSEIEKRLQKLYQVLESRGVSTTETANGKRKKVIRISTPTDGFQ